MGILKAIGFSDGHVFLLLIGEALVISLLGAAAGVGLAWLLTNVLHFNPKPDFFPIFYLPNESAPGRGGPGGADGIPERDRARSDRNEAQGHGGIAQRVTMAIPLSYSFRSIAVRKGPSAMAVGGIALVVVVFATLLSLAAGFQRVVETSGSPHNVIVPPQGHRRGTAKPGAAGHGPRDQRVADCRRGRRPETGGLRKRRHPGTAPSGAEARRTSRFAAHSPLARDVHADVRVTQGRWYTPGSNEAVLGVGLARRLRDIGLGQTLTVGRNTWHVVGLFEDRRQLAGIRTLDGRRVAAGFKQAHDVPGVAADRQRLAQADVSEPPHQAHAQHGLVGAGGVPAALRQTHVCMHVAGQRQHTANR